MHLSRKPVRPAESLLPCLRGAPRPRPLVSRLLRLRTFSPARPPEQRMTFESAPEPKRPRLKLQRLTSDLSRDWEFTLAAFESYRELPPHKKYRALGKLFEKLCPWIERGIQATVVSQFVLVPTEQVISRLFAQTTQKEALPKSYLLFLYWVESSVMRSLVNPAERYGVVAQTIGEPSVALCEKFNQLPFFDRSLLYLYVIENCTAAEVCDNAGVAYPRLLEDLPKLWAGVSAAVPPSHVPKSWRIPRVDEEGRLIVG